MTLPRSLWINGQWLRGHGEEMRSVNPLDERLLWHGRAADVQQVGEAVSAAVNAFPGWAAQPDSQRAACLLRFRDQLAQHRTLLADTIAQETGKPLWESDSEVASMIAKAELSLQAAEARCGEHSMPLGEAQSVLRHQPHGVLAVFGPYNFPGHLPNGHIMPALLAGNTLVFKPSELTPRTAELMIHLWQNAELPDGVLNLVQGGRDTGAALADEPRLNGLLFTGSASSGCYLHRQFGGRPEKILALEMGGNNPLYVEQCADTRAAVHHTLLSAYLSAGQRCSCARRLLVIQGSWGDRFIEALRQAIRRLEVGPYDSQPQPFMGSLICREAAERILAAQQQLQQLGGELLEPAEFVDSYPAMLRPGLLDMTSVADRPDEEYFGPLLQLIRVDNLEQAIAEANDTAYGLSAGILSEDPHHYQHFRQQVRAGLINWNRPLTGAASSRPFGGIGISGNHRPSAWYAADYCAYPVASLECESARLPEQLSPGLHL
ncbi:succinylglutamate-semialdehyde dehydrogenase [Marinobacterium arenosum]|uniref:succinylglutamate-semialdehyde dehydrogenase n=1 Tax=Marinobacterium arenosum TaxID=2862496 RepID=UPI001C95CEDB|nr:succinylglutamate-semialdehyde dehydrogenase [Marinobacterium arenosum]MBY4676473.1 succinylglutamate-semialdehyde dehydrogenase [Marinobacterium arenosum]